MEQKEWEILLALLKYKKLHLRKIAKTINQPHTTISRIMKKLLKKNIVDFRLEGKNKVFKLKKGIETLYYISIAEHFKILKLFEKYPQLSIITESILSKTNEKLIVIFGSYAKFKAKKDSDIDVYIETKDRKVKTKIEDINSKLNVKIGQFSLKDFLIKEIIDDHVIVKGIEYFYEKNKVFN